MASTALQDAPVAAHTDCVLIIVVVARLADELDQLVKSLVAALVAVGPERLLNLWLGAHSEPSDEVARSSKASRSKLVLVTAQSGSCVNGLRM